MIVGAHAVRQARSEGIQVLGRRHVVHEGQSTRAESPASVQTPVLVVIANRRQHGLALALHLRVGQHQTGGVVDIRRIELEQPDLGTAMVFVPSVKGISHNPAEHTDPQDLVDGADILLQVMLRLSETEFTS